MIIQEKVKINNVDFIYTYSNNKYLIKQVETGELYVDAYDLDETPKEYEETDIQNNMTENGE